MKKKIIIVACILISLLSGLGINENIFLSNSKEMIGILLTILGLCFSGFSFMLSSITRIINNGKNKAVLRERSKKLIKSIEEDIFLILYLIIVLIIMNMLFYMNIPVFNDPKNIDFNLFKIISFKSFIFNFSFSMCFCLSFYAFYDLIKATFSLLKSYYQ